MNPATLFSNDPNTVSLAPGDTLFREGEPGRVMYVLLDGTAEVRVGERVVETATTGALLGEMALIDDSPRGATVTATTPCRLAQVDLRRFHFMIQQNPYFATHVMKVLVTRVRQVNRLLGTR